MKKTRILIFSRGKSGTVQFLLNPKKPENLSFSLDSFPAANLGERIRSGLETLFTAEIGSFNLRDHETLSLREEIGENDPAQVEFKLCEIGNCAASFEHSWYPLPLALSLGGENSKNMKKALLWSVQIIADTKNELIEVTEKNLPNTSNTPQDFS